MSLVTNAIVAWGCGEDDEEILTALNKAIVDSCSKFVRVDESVEGPKCMEATVAIAAFNYFGTHQILPVMRTVVLPLIEDITKFQVFIKEQDDDCFLVYGENEEWRDEEKERP